MNELPLTLAIEDYDHVRDLVSGNVKPAGIDLNCQIFQVEENLFVSETYKSFKV
jgi:4,5-dihydroxyphthalate decarboxylase